MTWTYRKKIQLLEVAKDEGQMRVLLVEDEQVLADGVGRGARLDGTTDDVLDDESGTVVALRTTTRVFMLTAAADLGDQVESSRPGVDHGLEEAPALAELAAKVWALARGRESAPAVLVWQDLRLDPTRMEATRAGRPLQLSRKEFGVLQELMGVNGAVVSADQLMSKVWTEDAALSRTAIRVTMVGLRRKLGLPLVVQTVRGAGYQLELNP